MFASDERGVAGAFTSSGGHHSGPSTEERISGLRKDAIVKLAGPAANVRFARKKNFSEGADDDIKAARNFALTIALLQSGHALPHHHDGLIVEVDQSVVGTGRIGRPTEGCFPNDRKFTRG
jgi:hypothetical protein